MRLIATGAALQMVFLVSFATAIPHGDHVDMNAGPMPHMKSNGPMSYFAYGKHSDTVFAHLALMMLGWCFVLPAGKKPSTVIGLMEKVRAAINLSQQRSF